MLKIQQRREDILNIYYNLQKGLTFSWNFRGLLTNNTYFRHLFVVYNQLTPFLEKMLRNIYSKIKIGDFFAVLLLQTENTAINTELKWVQKTSLNPNNTIKLSNYFNNYNQSLETDLQYIGEEANSYNDPVIVNFCLNYQEDAAKYAKIIEKLRTNGLYPYFVNFLSNFQEHDVSVPTGFNQISLSQESGPQVLKIYKALSYETAILSAKIELQSHGIEINNKNGDLWKSIDFNKVQRCYYGPSIYYNQDFIDFVDECKLKQENNLHISIKLEIKLFSGVKLTSNKIMVLQTGSMKMNMLTKVIGMQSKSTFEFGKMIRSRTQPFCSSSYLFLTKMQSENKGQMITN